MSVISVTKDYESLTLVLVAEFDAPIDRVWQLWADPRQLERWWGPPTYPATVERHDLAPGGEIGYFMTGPDGTRSYGWWRVTALDPPVSLEFTEGFANGTPNAETPSSTVHVSLQEGRRGTRMELRFRFESRDQMEELEGFGMFEGVAESVGQMDAVLAG